VAEGPGHLEEHREDRSVAVSARHGVKQWGIRWAGILQLEQRCTAKDAHQRDQALVEGVYW